MPKYTKWLVLVCAVLWQPASSHDPSASEARVALKSLGIEYTRTAFCRAVAEDDVAIVRLFHIAGTSLETQCGYVYGKTALYQSVDWGRYKTYNYLVGQDVNLNVGIDAYSVLTRAIAHSQYDMVYDLLRRGASAAKAHYKHSSLSYALLECNPTLVKALLENGASANERIYNKGGPTALHNAAMNGCTSTVDVLLKHGADVGAKTDEGATVLINAVRSGSADVVGRVLAAGADTKERTIDGISALFIAVVRGQRLVAHRLLEGGADANEKYTVPLNRLKEFDIKADDLQDALQHGATPVMVAASKGDLRMAKLLQIYGAEVDVSVNGRLGTHTPKSIGEFQGR